jgi:hypothetical protein
VGLFSLAAARPAQSLLRWEAAASSAGSLVQCANCAADDRNGSQPKALKDTTYNPFSLLHPPIHAMLHNLLF